MRKFLIMLFVPVLMIAFANSGFAASANSARWQGETTVSANFAAEVLELVNIERAKLGIAPLKLSPDLMRAAGVRAEELPESFSHTRPNGSSCFTVIKSSYSVVGENIAAGQRTSAAVVESWMNSPGHRENILNAKFSRLGVGYINAPDTDYKHYWVQLFKG